MPKPSELQQRLKEVEQRFLAVAGPLDSPERQALWPELGRLNSALKHPADAALCWSDSGSLKVQSCMKPRIASAQGPSLIAPLRANFDNG